MNHDTFNHKVIPIVEKFVSNLNGFYQSDCSNNLLVSLISYKLDHRSNSDSQLSTIDAIINGDPNEAYIAVCWLFESVLEHRCSLGGNGHHVAQEFSAFLTDELKRIGLLKC